MDKGFLFINRVYPLNIAIHMLNQILLILAYDIKDILSKSNYSTLIITCNNIIRTLKA